MEPLFSQIADIKFFRCIDSPPQLPDSYGGPTALSSCTPANQMPSLTEAQLLNLMHVVTNVAATNSIGVS
jgi:hypothetical protein